MLSDLFFFRFRFECPLSCTRWVPLMNEHARSLACEFTPFFLPLSFTRPSSLNGRAYLREYLQLFALCSIIHSVTLASCASCFYALIQCARVSVRERESANRVAHHRTHRGSSSRTFSVRWGRTWSSVAQRVVSREEVCREPTWLATVHTTGSRVNADYYYSGGGSQ